MGVVALVVMEPGSAWPGYVGTPDDVVAVGYHEGLLEKTGQGLEVLRCRGRRVRVAVLACNEATDAASVRRRAAVAHALLVAVTAVGFGRLVLSSAEGAPMRLRRELLSLAGALSFGLPGTSATVSVRFGAATGAWPQRRRTESAAS